MPSLPALPFAVALVGVLIAAGTDLWRFRLHNWLTIPLLVSGLVYHATVAGAGGLAGSVLGMLFGGLPFLAVYAMGGMGAGDIKLLAAVGAWLGPWAVLHVVIFSGLATGGYSAGLWGWTRMRVRMQPAVVRSESRISAESRCGAARADVAEILNRADRRRHAVPFGVMVAVGVVVTRLWIV